MILPIALTTPEWLAVIVGLVVVNTIPVFMPPTWALLTWLNFQESGPIWALAATGAITSTIGRGVLASVSRQVGPRVLPRRWRENIQAVVDLLLSRRSLRASSLALFAWGPVSSNYLFIAAGISGVPLLPPLVIYACARFISYMIVISATKTTIDSFDDILDSGIQRGWLAAAPLVGIGILIIVMRHDWSKVISRLMPDPPATEPEHHDAGRKG